MTRLVRDVLNSWAERAGLAKPSRAAMVLSRWPELVGPAVAAHARAEKVERGVLTVRVESSVWATELSTHIPVILERIGLALGEEVVTDVRFLTGAGPGRGVGAETSPGGAPIEPPWPDRHDLEPVVLSDEEVEFVRSFVASVTDPELAGAGARWITNTLKARRWLQGRAETRGRRSRPTPDRRRKAE